MLSPFGPVFRGPSYKSCCQDQVPCSDYQQECCPKNTSPSDPGNLVLFNFGAYDGKALSKWLAPEKHPENVVSSILVNEGLLDRFSAERVHLVAVEPNPEAFPSLKAAKEMWEQEHGFKVTIVEAAASVNNSTMRFGAYVRQDGGSDRDGMRISDQGTVEIPTIDTSGLIFSHCRPGDICICAFDVEGAEFAILRDLFFKQPSVGCLCDVLVVEWHELIGEDQEYLLVNDFGDDKFSLRHIPEKLLSAAVMDGAMRYMLEARDQSCPTIYVGFRYDQGVFDI